VDWFACLFEKKITNFESFSFEHNLVIFQKKHKKTRILATFVFDPTLFQLKTDKLPQKSHQSSQMTNMLAKQIFMTF
jgi:hypothetical protein